MSIKKRDVIEALGLAYGAAASGALVSKAVGEVYDYFDKRDFKPIQAGVDYETEGIDTYKPGQRREFTDDGERINAPIIPNRNPIYGSFDDGVWQKGDPESPGWDPMPTTTGQTIYDMTERGPEGEVIHRKPMQGPHGRPNVLDVAPEGGMIKEVLDSDKSIMEEGSPPSDEELLKVVGYVYF